MDNNSSNNNHRDDFSGSPHRNFRGGGAPNFHSADLNRMAQIDPQLAAALDFEELRLRRQLELQQDMELRRRILEEQQHQQLLSELDHRRQIQQLQQLQAHQAQLQQQQNQQQAHATQQQLNLNQLLAQNPHLLEELQHHQQIQQQQQQQQAQQQQQFNLSQQLGGRGGGGGGPGPDEYDLLRRQLLLQQEMQQQQRQRQQQEQQQRNQQQQEQFARSSQSPMVAAMLNASQNNNRLFLDNVMSRGGGGNANNELIAQQLQQQAQKQQLQQQLQQQQQAQAQQHARQQRQLAEQQQLQQQRHMNPPPAAPTPLQQQANRRPRTGSTPSISAPSPSEAKTSGSGGPPPSDKAPVAAAPQQPPQQQHHEQQQLENKSMPTSLAKKSTTSIPSPLSKPSPKASPSSQRKQQQQQPDQSNGQKPQAQKEQKESRKGKKRSQSEATITSDDVPLVSMKTKKRKSKSSGEGDGGKMSTSEADGVTKTAPPLAKNSSPTKSKREKAKDYVEDVLKPKSLAAALKKEDEVEAKVAKSLESQKKKSTVENAAVDDKATPTSSEHAPEKKEKTKDEPPVKKTRRKKSSKEAVEAPSTEAVPADTVTSIEPKKKSKTSPKPSAVDEPKAKENKFSSSKSKYKSSKKSLDPPDKEDTSINSVNSVSHESNDLTDHEKNLIRHLMVHEGTKSPAPSDDSSKKGKSKSKKKDAHPLSSSDQPRKKKKSKTDTSKTAKKDKKTSKDEGEDKVAADVVLNFKSMQVSAREVRRAKKWNDAMYPPYVKYVVPDGSPMLTPMFEFNLPSLPIEPEQSFCDDENIDAIRGVAVDSNGANETPSDSTRVDVEMMVSSPGRKGTATEPISLVKPKKVYAPKTNNSDTWWPSDSNIRRERRMREEPSDVEDTDEEIDDDSHPTIAKASIDHLKNRMASSTEPGVLEKIPHCRLYEDYCAKKYANEKMPEPKFCCQVTEHFMNDIMVCCSKCSTWRHVQCGGHYKHYSHKSIDPSDAAFEPICDQCYLEQNVMKGKENATVDQRLDRQRIEHLRRSNATNAVMRQASFAKHSGQYKWPLGSVSAGHNSSHTRSVQIRHDKSEKQWGEIATKLSGGMDFRPKEKIRVRTREFEKLLVNVEDAEGVTDRHNMVLFLQRDTSKPQPAGFEGFRRNIFDPKEDPPQPENPDNVATPPPESETYTLAASMKSGSKDDAQSAIVSPGSASKERDGNKPTLMEMEVVPRNDGKSPLKKRVTKKKEQLSLLNGKPVCARRGCQQHPRFDSIFCSDACGVSALEFDLLRSLQYAGEMHPSSLRP